MTTTPAPERLTDTRVMAVVHSMFRREFRLAAGLVRAVTDGDVARGRVVADHLVFIADALHRHHTLEDRMLWPLLQQRVPADLAPVVDLMEAQHRTVDGLLDLIAVVRPRWARHASGADGEELATLHDRLYVHLVEHLDAEEQRLLPLAARATTQDEWDEMGEMARRETPRRDRSLTLGMYAYEGDPASFATMLAGAPGPVRAVVPRLAGRAFRRHARRVHGTATP